MSFNESTHSKWLDAYSDSEANVYTLTQCIAYVGSIENNYRLVVADLKFTDDSKPKLKVYSGTSLLSEQILPNLPVGVVGFYMDRTQPLVPGVAVACGSDVLIFRNNKPYFKFSLPTLPVLEKEQEIWHQLLNSTLTDAKIHIDALNAVPYESLTSRSQTLLSLSENEYMTFINQFQSSTLKRTTVITCMATLYKKEESVNAVSCIVLGTEVGDLLFLDPQGFTIIHQARVSPTKATPTSIKCIGQYDVDFRCIISCRENVVCLFRRGWLEGRVLFTLAEGSIVELEIIPGELNIIVVDNRGEMQCYNKKGKKLWTIALPNSAVTLTTIHLHHLSTTLVAVALRGGVIRLYKGRQYVDTIVLPNTVSAMKFGPLGQEESVLVIFTVDGSLIIKILKRTADFSVEILQENNVASHQVKALQIPKKSKLFVEQTNRERQNAVAMHQMFQQDLYLLRLTAARALVQSMETGENTNLPLRLSAQVLGFGPVFTLVISLENMSSNNAISQLAIVFHASNTQYKTSRPYLPLPMLVPNVTYKFQTKVTEVRCNEETNESEDLQNTVTPLAPIKVFIIKISQAQPLLAATIRMPITDPTIWV